MRDTRDREVKLAPPRTFTEEGDKTGEIEESIVGKKIRRGETFYLVKWKGFHSRFNTWEGAQHLVNEGCQESIDNYEGSVVGLNSI